uniref:G_PROTEIN_RECEP_F1_2 domain-containing protein n=1 Tax=Ascaris lumbricoides TaxID=6252 RepID=A0A0M3HEV2_ASCLU
MIFHIVWKLLLALIVFILDVLCAIIILCDKVFRHAVPFLLIVTILLLDALSLLTIIIYDAPSQIIGRPLFGDPYTAVIVLITSVVWFMELLLLPTLALTHYSALCWPMWFRRLNVKHVIILLLILLLVSLALTAPLFTPCCGFKFYVPGFYWSFDEEKPGTPIYNQFNLYLQAFALGTMLLFDFAIVYNLAMLKRKKFISEGVTFVRTAKVYIDIVAICPTLATLMYSRRDFLLTEVVMSGKV